MLTLSENFSLVQLHAEDGTQLLPQYEYKNRKEHTVAMTQ